MLQFITAETADWDIRGDYSAKNLEVYYEGYDRSHLYRVDHNKTLAAILKSKG